MELDLVVVLSSFFLWLKWELEIRIDGCVEEKIEGPDVQKLEGERKSGKYGLKDEMRAAPALKNPVDLDWEEHRV